MCKGNKKAKAKAKAKEGFLQRAVLKAKAEAKEGIKVKGQILVPNAPGYLADSDKTILLIGYNEVIDELDMIIKTVETC